MPVFKSQQKFNYMPRHCIKLYKHITGCALKTFHFFALSRSLLFLLVTVIVRAFMTAVKTDDGTQRRATEILPGLSSRTRQNGPFVVRGPTECPTSHSLVAISLPGIVLRFSYPTLTGILLWAYVCRTGHTAHGTWRNWFRQFSHLPAFKTEIETDFCQLKLYLNMLCLSLGARCSVIPLHGIIIWGIVFSTTQLVFMVAFRVVPSRLVVILTKLSQFLCS